MEKVIVSNEAYDEFKSFLDEREIESYNIRINFAGSGCSGPSFNITLSEKETDDLVEQIKDITFLIKPDLYNEFGAFVLLSNEENDGNGLHLRPLVKPLSGCEVCNRCN